MTVSPSAIVVPAVKLRPAGINALNAASQAIIFDMFRQVDGSDRRLHDGVGLGPDHQTGVGLVAMRERAIELGGVFSVTSAEPHGTRVHAAFPAAMP